MLDNTIITHSFIAKDLRNPNRTIEAVRWSNFNTSIRISTFWNGPESKPFVTEMTLTQEALELLSRALHDAAHNMEKYKLTSSEEESCDE